MFDGDVDPEWVENLNSVLDNNKLLTLPNGERLSIPSNVRIMFEVPRNLIFIFHSSETLFFMVSFQVHDLKFATLATVSRCGMVWFSEDTLTPEMVMENYLLKLRHVSLDESDDDVKVVAGGGVVSASMAVSVHLLIWVDMNDLSHCL